MMAALEIPQEILLEMQAQAREQAPLEACGILAGKGDQVAELYKMTNTDQSSEHFAMAPEEQFAVVKQMRTKGHRMLGIYHSHPVSPARPSDEDIRLALTPEVLHVILSLQQPSQPVVRAFRIDQGEVTESAVKIVEDL